MPTQWFFITDFCPKKGAKLASGQISREEHLIQKSPAELILRWVVIESNRSLRSSSFPYSPLSESKPKMALLLHQKINCLNDN